MPGISACERKQHDPRDFNNANDMLDHATLLANRPYAAVKKRFRQRRYNKQGNNGSHAASKEGWLKPISNATF